jgi:hypothetical protein
LTYHQQDLKKTKKQKKTKNKNKKNRQTVSWSRYEAKKSWGVLVPPEQTADIHFYVTAGCNLC